ncbi:Rieske 2Fe-2S domain-containing protein [Rhizobium sp. CSW-27]|uniref:Rieske 2Fe-2S domain-containing protein n=1 Tax=Rhizobium sp. CSW-27 TaxID=2839985 RepID=UPI001C0283A6|nr:Rieske 2Fe-2S domain-containing protein [Rhizobium sp. CSW-27]MBT9372855.1 Rieske 2Fe-2S domain-containing protein [Rhizobium sp. CSW-27]
MPVALSSDIPPATVIPLQTPSGPMALWRSASGRLSMSADRCPHRGMRLSHGFVRGEALSCIYHGWSYSQDGHCLRIPAHPDLEPPAAIRVATATVCETGGVVWLALAQTESQPPRFSHHTPLRSLAFAAAPTAILVALNGRASADGSMQGELAGLSVILLCAPQPDGTSMVHVLAPSDATLEERLAISSATEALRRTAETALATEAAA